MARNSRSFTASASCPLSRLPFAVGKYLTITLLSSQNGVLFWRKGPLRIIIEISNMEPTFRICSASLDTHRFVRQAITATRCKGHVRPEYLAMRNLPTTNHKSEWPFAISKPHQGSASLVGQEGALWCGRFNCSPGHFRLEYTQVCGRHIKSYATICVTLGFFYSESWDEIYFYLFIV